MKRYTGKLSSQLSKSIEQNKNRLLKIVIGAGLGKVANNNPVYSIDESLQRYNPTLSTEEVQIWVWYRRLSGTPMLNWKKYFIEPTETQIHKWVSDGLLFFDTTRNQTLVPYPIFVFGNIYEKISKTKAAKDKIIENFGTSVYENHIKILEDLKPAPLSISNPVESERPVVLAISELARTFMVSSLKDVILKEPATLKEAYKDWLRAQSDETFKNTKAFEIINYYLENEAKPRSIDKIEWGVIKKATRDEGERLFKIFLHTSLEYQDQFKIDIEYNSKYNATAPLQYQKIPVALQTSKLFKNFELKLSPAQCEGVAFMELVGSGIIAYDVGVGKTITAIINVLAAILQGKCSRPVIAVPNPTYKNWILEMFGNDDVEGILTGTGITLNDWYNLGSEYDHIDVNKKVDANSITLVSYEGLEKIGFNQFTQDDHFLELSKIISQSENGTSRDIEKENEKLRQIIGVGNKETIADIETLGFDFIVVDEAHNFKNVFSEVKSDEENGKQFHIRGGEPSNRGIKLFFLCNYIQRKYGRNTMLLTATPFTNSPLEIYSMLSFVAHQYMKDNAIYNLRTFFEQYIQETTEYVVGIDGEIQQKNVVKSFNNRISLQKLINSHINFKTGEEANVPRPCKINLPKTSVATPEGVRRLKPDEQTLTYLKMTPLQAANQREINAKASEGANQDDPGRLLRLMSQSLNNALTPFLYSGKPSDYFEFVEESPKIKYTMECIRSVKKWHEDRNEPVSGQVIYIDRGKEFFGLIKEYLEKELGYKKGVSLLDNPRLKVDEVEIISSGISQAQKEKVKQAFNEGTCKIIIGTSTIKEGINLQEKSTVLYNLYPNWNPTDIRQLEGRVWRQKNIFAYVRIVMPLMENSMDIFVFQKLEEKTSRINDLWAKSDRGNVLDEESLDPNEVKFALVTDLGVLARFELKQIATELYNKTLSLNNNIKDLESYTSLKSAIDGYRQIFAGKIPSRLSTFNSVVVFDGYGNDRMLFEDVASMSQSKIEGLTKEKQYRIEQFKKLYDLMNNTLQTGDDKSLIQSSAQYERLVLGNSYNYMIEGFKEKVSQFAKIRRTIFDQRGYSDSTDLSVIKAAMEKDLLLVSAEVEELKTPEFQDKLLTKIQEQKAKYSIKGGELMDRVKDFAALNYLMSYKFDINKKHCDLPVIELKPNKDDRERKLRLAKAKAKALRIKLRLVA